MLRHLPLAVCQFDMNGNVMYQNPEASLTSNDILGNDDDEEDNESNNNPNTNNNEPNKQQMNGHYGENDNDYDDATRNSPSDKGGRDETSSSTSSSSFPDTVASPSCEAQRRTTTRTNNADDNDDNNSTTSYGTTGTNNSSSSTMNGIHNKRIKKKTKTKTTAEEVGSFINRFVDPVLGRQILHDIQSNTNNTHNSNNTTQNGQQQIQQQQQQPQQNDEMTFEAMLKTRKGPKSCVVQIRQSKDPVTSEKVILFSARDNSDAHRAERERLAKEQKSEFLAIMAHEIRTPLHQVIGFIDLLAQTALSMEQQSFIHLLKVSAQGLMTVISDVLDYSKLEAGKMKIECISYEPYNVVQGSMEAVRQSCEERNLYLFCSQWDKTIPFQMIGDPNRLRQILLNLLSNAVKFTKQGGITIQAQVVQRQDVQNKEDDTNNKKKKKIDDNQNNNNNNNSDNNNHNNNNSQQQQSSSSVDVPSPIMVKFSVIDTGVGMAKEHQEIIFRKYQQANVSVARQYGGTGLGLSICQLLVQGMGGSIGVSSEVGKGSCFWFTIPTKLVTTTSTTQTKDDNDDDDEGGNDEMDEIQKKNNKEYNCISSSKKNAQQQEMKNNKTTSSSGCSSSNGNNNNNNNKRKKLHILVVEDNKVNQKLVAHMIKRMGYSCDLADHGKMAIDMIQQQQQEQQQEENNSTFCETTIDHHTTSRSSSSSSSTTTTSTTIYDCCLMDIQVSIPYHYIYLYLYVNGFIF